jgi:hypothetical protein
MRGSKGLLMVRCHFLEIADHHHSVNSSCSISTKDTNVSILSGVCVLRSQFRKQSDKIKQD